MRFNSLRWSDTLPSLNKRRSRKRLNWLITLVTLADGRSVDGGWETNFIYIVIAVGK